MKKIIIITAIGMLFGSSTVGLLAEESAETAAENSRQEDRSDRRSRKEHPSSEQLAEKRAEIEAEIKARREEVDRKRAEQLAKNLGAAKTEEAKKAIQENFSKTVPKRPSISNSACCSSRP